MEAAAKLSSKGQLTVPKAVRDALGLTEGDRGFSGGSPVCQGRVSPS